MDFSSDEKHRATLEVLREALAYLQRLPAVPVTRQLCVRLQAHLDEPTQRLVSRGVRELYGTGPFTPAGLPLLDASVVEDALTVRLAAGLQGQSRQEALAEVRRQLLAGPLRLHLQARKSVPD